MAMCIIRYSLCLAERHSEGVGVGVSRVNALRREIIHRLFINPLIHSQIIKLFRVSHPPLTSLL